jgi:hypothetical protein
LQQTARHAAAAPFVAFRRREFRSEVGDSLKGCVMNLFCRAACGAVLLAGALAAAGCGSSAGYKMADATGLGVLTLRDDVIRMKTSTDSTLASMGEVSRQAAVDPRAAYEAFALQVTHLDAALQTARNDAEAMKTSASDYFRKWEEDLAAVANAESRKVGTDRRAKVQQGFYKSEGAVQRALTLFAGFLSDLKDLRVVLGNDITQAGIEAAKELMQKRMADGARMKETLDGAIVELNAIAASMVPEKSQPAPKE